MSTLPAKGRWALGTAAQPLAEALLAVAVRQGLRIGWLGPEAGFLSNLSLQENLRLMHDWHETKTDAFAADLQAALDVMQLPMPDWLYQRPSQLLEEELLHARLLRVLLLRPEVLVLNPLILAQAGAVLRKQLVDVFSGASLYLLDQPSQNWPAWPAHEISPDPVEEYPA